VAKLVNELRTKATEFRNATVDLHAELIVLVQRLGVPTDLDRTLTSVAGRDLLRDISATTDDAALLHLLATCDIPTTEAALGKSITSAQQVSAAIKKTNWQLLENATKLAGAFTADAEVLKRKVESAVADDEFVTPLQAALEVAEAQATELIGRAITILPPPPPTPGPVPGNETVVLDSRTLQSLSRDEARAKLTELGSALEQSADDAVLDLTWSIRAPKTQT